MIDFLKREWRLSVRRCSFDPREQKRTNRRRSCREEWGGMAFDAHGRRYLANTSPVEAVVIVFNTTHGGTESGILLLREMLAGDIVDASGKLCVGMRGGPRFRRARARVRDLAGNAELPPIPQGLPTSKVSRLTRAASSKCRPEPTTGVSRVLLFAPHQGNRALRGSPLQRRASPRSHRQSLRFIEAGQARRVRQVRSLAEIQVRLLAKRRRTSPRSHRHLWRFIKGGPRAPR